MTQRTQIARARLVYLALEGRLQRHLQVALLLRPELDQRQALNNPAIPVPQLRSTIPAGDGLLNDGESERLTPAGYRLSNVRQQNAG